MTRNEYRNAQTAHAALQARANTIADWRAVLAAPAPVRRTQSKHSARVLDTLGAIRAAARFFGL